MIGGSTPPLLTKKYKNNENYLEVSKKVVIFVLWKVLINNDTKIFQKKVEINLEVSKKVVIFVSWKVLNNINALVAQLDRATAF